MSERLQATVALFFSSWSFVIHTFFFIAWFWLSLNVNLLTNVVSLESIYLTLAVGLATKGHHETTREHIAEKLETFNAND